MTLGNYKTAIDRGTVFLPMQWGELWAKDAEANAFTHPEFCPDSRQPELKAFAVDLYLVKVLFLLPVH
jgi:ferredoxin-nitrate reductase